MIPIETSLGWFAAGGGISMVLSSFILLEDSDDKRTMHIVGLPFFLFGFIVLVVTA